jgi:hypothetical protein
MDKNIKKILKKAPDVAKTTYKYYRVYYNIDIRQIIMKN